jgi:hypothetical protein
MRRGWSRRVGIAAIACAAAAALAAPAQAQPLVGLTNANQLFRFDSAAPTQTGALIAVAGLNPSDTLIAIDRDPSTGLLYGLGKQSRVYRIDEAGAATPSGGVLSTPLSGQNVTADIDFDPRFTGVARITTNSDQNLTWRSTEGARADAKLAWAPPHAADSPSVTALAYSHNVPGGDSPTAFVYDAAGDELAVLGSPGGSPSGPETGRLTSVGPSGVTAVSSVGGLDAAPDGTTFALLRSAPGTEPTATRLFTIDTGTGRATAATGDPATSLVGTGANTTVDIATDPVRNTFVLGTDQRKVSESDGAAEITVSRSQALGTATVDYATADGSAVAGSDYTETDGTLTFADGEVSEVISIPIAADAESEGRETLTLSISHAQGGVASVGSPSSATVAITNVRDRTRPVLRSCTKGRQNMVRQRAVVACFKSSEAGAASATGRLTVAVKGRSFRLRKASRAVVKGRRVSLRLRLPRKAVSAVRTVRRAHRGATATVTITVRDKAGRTSRLIRRIRAR